MSWKIFLYLFHSLIILPLDYHLFQSLQNSLIEKYFWSKDCKEYLKELLSEKDRNLLEDEIMKLIINDPLYF